MSAQDEELAREWFHKAERDLLTAQAMLGTADVPTDIVCFHCEQVGEKYLKGFLTWHMTPATRTHDLAALLVECTGFDARLASLQPLAIRLTDFAVDVRYPGLPHSDPSLQEALEALDAAREIRLAIRMSLGLPV